MATVLNYRTVREIPPGTVNIMRPGIFGNPFVIGPDGTREEVIDKFQEWLLVRVRNDASFAEKVKELAGKHLLCCCEPLPCHGDVLSTVADLLLLDCAF